MLKLSRESIIGKLKGKSAKTIYGLIAAAGIFAIAFLILFYGGGIYLITGIDEYYAKDEIPGKVMVEKGDTVYVNYTGKLENGTVFDSGNLSFVAGFGQEIFGFFDRTVFDEEITGMENGEEKTITIPREKAFGDFDPGRVITIEKIIILHRFENISAEQYKKGTGKEPVPGETLIIPDLPWPVRIAAVMNDTLLMDIAPGAGKIPDIIGERIVTLKDNEVILSLKTDIELAKGKIIRTEQGNAKISEINETAITLDFNHPLAGKTLILAVKVYDIVKKNEGKTEVKSLLASDSEKIPGLTIVVYSEFQCPYSGKAAPVLNSIKETYGDKIEIIFKHFPLTFHRDAQKAAEASECARDQEKFWEYHDKLFSNQDALSVDNLKQYAFDLELDTEKFDKCLISGEKESKVKNDIWEGQNEGVSGTPTFFIEDYKLVGAQPYDVFEQIIDEKLK